MEVGMMFRKLARGAKFDTERFLSDAQKLQIVRTESLDYSPLRPAGVAQEMFELKPEDNANDIGVKPSKKLLKRQAAANVNAIRKASRIHIWGSDLPNPIENFANIPKMTPELLDNIRKSDYDVPTPVQMQAIPIMLTGREILASAPTGSGKTAAFLIPIILLLEKSNPTNGFRALILAPTRELAKQIYRESVRLSEGTGLIVCILDNAKKVRGDILISTPNRLVYQLKSESISLRNIVHLIVDECDHLFESGFVDQLGSIYSACDSPGIKRAFFSATCAFEVEQFCKTHLDNHILLSVGPKNAAGADLVQQSVVFAGNESGKLVAFRNLLRNGIEPPVLVFVQSQERADELLSELVFEGIKCNVIHSGKSEVQRERIVESFREGKIWILVCTALLSRGLDFPAVKLVINYDMPTTPVQYIHSIGRTGRAGRIGKSITFYTEDDKQNLRRTAQVLENSGFPVPPFLLKIKKVRKDEAQRLAHRPPKRARISRKVKYDVEKKFKFSEMVKHSKKLKSGVSNSKPPNLKSKSKDKSGEREEDGEQKHPTPNKMKTKSNPETTIGTERNTNKSERIKGKGTASGVFTPNFKSKQRKENNKKRRKTE